MLAKDNIPLSTSEKPCCIYFMRKAAPVYKIPSRKMVTNLIQSKYDVLSSLVKTKLSIVEYMTITTDIWTDVINTNSFLGMTVHFKILPNLSWKVSQLGCWNLVKAILLLILVIGLNNF